MPGIDSPNDNLISYSGGGGIFLNTGTIPSSIINTVSADIQSCNFPAYSRKNRSEFLCLSLSIKDNKNGGTTEGTEAAHVKRLKVRLRGRGAVKNTTKHLWAGAVAAMVSRLTSLNHHFAPYLKIPSYVKIHSAFGFINLLFSRLFQLRHCTNHCSSIRTFLAPLERLKLEYIVRGEKKNLYDLINRIATTQGLRGFWKGNFVNILRTAPFKAINFCAYDTYRKQLLKLSGNEETTNSERFIAGAAAGITATVLCLPLDTIRTKLVAPGGEALGGVIGAFRHIVQNEGVFSLYKGLVPSILSMAPSAAVFYGVYDILKTAYLHSPEGRKRIENMKQKNHELNAFEQLELGSMRTLLHGAIAGACAEVATYPFEVLRRQLQLQGRATKLSALAIGVKIVERGGVPALYAGLIPSLLQVYFTISELFFWILLYKLVWCFLLYKLN
ncbi:hypothetical protein RD792_011160 [Penstemon davidsonii]|uniref:Mitochondrial adenine nucleotide transporter BTL3 n=1 Tax=Penstemon davidsonii TaxID=160366 RepID=A0ABR0D414_9LAMI|nr:hypothetical protein RD792_011160 [Penstemon davidsonii]